MARFAQSRRFYGKVRLLLFLIPYAFFFFLVATPTVNVLFEAKAEVGEGPFYDPKANELIWVDIEGMSINFISLSSNTNRKLQMKEKPSIAIPCRSGKGLLVTLCRKLCIIDRNTGKKWMVFQWFFYEMHPNTCTPSPKDK